MALGWQHQDILPKALCPNDVDNFPIEETIS